MILGKIRKQKKETRVSFFKDKVNALSQTRGVPQDRSYLNLFSLL
jgi:hypothetical protein